MAGLRLSCFKLAGRSFLPADYAAALKIFQKTKIKKMKRISTLITALIILCVTAHAQLVVFADDYAPGVSFAGFGGATNTLTIDNTQSHSGTASLKIAVTTGYTGGAFVNASNIDLSAYNAVSFWAKNDNPAFKLDAVGLGNNATTTVYAVERNGVVLSSTWTKYYIPIPVASKLTAENGLFHFAEGSGEGAYNIWIDDIQYENVNTAVLGTPTAAFATETMSKFVGDNFNANGTVSVYPVCAEGAMQTARAYFTWSSSNNAVATINSLGTGTAVAVGTSNITAQLGSINAAGTLTVNVSPALEEPTVAAPDPPARSAADVISLFSGVYTDLPGTDWFPNWGQSTIVTDVDIASNPTKKYTNFNYQGVQFANPVDASQMTKLHIDIWTPNCTAFDVYPIVLGQPEQFVTLKPTFSGWNSFDIDLSQYTIPLNSIIQLKFVGTPFGSSTVYYDNLYFYRSSSVTEPTTAAPVPTENEAGVISLFSNVYTNEPVDTWSASWDQADVADVQVNSDDTKKYTNLVYAGIEFTSNPIDATNMDYYHVDIWTPDATVFKVKLVDFGNDGVFGGGDDTESELSYTPALGEWVSYDIPMSDFTGLASRAHLAQMLFIGSNSTLYTDNIYFYNKLLPVRFAGFNVAKKSNITQIQWSTAFEQNNKGFSIQRSKDGINWNQIQFVNGTNKGSLLKTYSVNDLMPLNGINYYRIVQIDFDGKESYTEVKSLVFDNQPSIKFTVYPNPAVSKINIALGTIENDNANYYLINAQGTIVLSGLFNKTLSNTVQVLHAENLPRGSYVLMIADGANKQSAKLILY